jgi:hypothetical protein
MPQWLTVIVESERIIDGRPLDLTEQLQRLADAGWSVGFVLPNGVNRWTVIASRETTLVLPES